jgi:RNA polymerase sigma factor (sigma-70 family)
MNHVAEETGGIGAGELPRWLLDPELATAVRRLRAGVEVEASWRAADGHLRPRLRAYFLSRSFRPEDADDLVQAVLLRVHQSVRQLRDEGSFLPWLFTIARNLSHTAASRQTAARGELPGDHVVAELVDDRPGPEAISAASESLCALREAVHQLPARQRQCLLLRVVEELSYEEIAATLGLSAHTVRNHLAEARRQLRQNFAMPVRQEVEP